MNFSSCDALLATSTKLSVLIMERKKSAIIEENLDSLTKLTKNFEDVLEKLQDYDVLTASELEHVVCRYFYVVYRITQKFN